MWLWMETRLGTICCRFGEAANELQCKCMCVAQLSAAQSLFPACQTCPMLPCAETTKTHFLVQRLLLLSLKALLKVLYTSFHPEILHPIHNVAYLQRALHTSQMAFLIHYDINLAQNNSLSVIGTIIWLGMPLCWVMMRMVRGKLLIGNQVPLRKWQEKGFETLQKLYI